MEKIIPLDKFPYIPLLFGSYNCNIKLLRKIFKVDIIARDHIAIHGDKDSVERTGKAVNAMQQYLLQRGIMTFSQVEEIVARFVGDEPTPSAIPEDYFPVRPRTAGQKDYMKAIRDNTVVFGIGPAGTGKTYLAVAMAVDALHKGSVRKIILVRPAVEAGEKLGFLPGDFQAKINPYLRPLYDALYDILQYDKLKKYLQRDMIEIAPLAYMRGRTLESSFVILDEAQNTTISQMKMFLTRLGFYSKVVITGDITQMDLPNEERSGLLQAINILQNISDLHFFYFTPKDIVRHPLVQKIVEAYDNIEDRHSEKPK